MLQAGGPDGGAVRLLGPVAFASFKACVVIGMSGVAAIGYFFGRISLAERVSPGSRRRADRAQFPLQRYRPALFLRRSCSGDHVSGRATRWRRLESVYRSAGVAKALSIGPSRWCGPIRSRRPTGRKTGASRRKARTVQARVKGSGAGMEPPPEARLVDGWFQWQPNGRRYRTWCLAIQGLPGNGGCAMMETARHCRRFSGIQSASMSRP